VNGHDDIVVMYAGRVVESGPAPEIVRAPRHPYTAALLDVAPGDHPARRRLALPDRGRLMRARQAPTRSRS
jgi:peptide/nickel transport system ATP-binding protein